MFKTSSVHFCCNNFSNAAPVDTGEYLFVASSVIDIDLELQRCECRLSLRTSLHASSLRALQWSSIQPTQMSSLFFKEVMNHEVKLKFCNHWKAKRRRWRGQLGATKAQFVFLRLTTGYRFPSAAAILRFYLKPHCSWTRSALRGCVCVRETTTEEIYTCQFYFHR